MVIPSGRAGGLPAAALTEAVDAFNADGTSPPSLEHIALDWSCSPLTSSRWNSEAITILSVDFYNLLKAATYPDVIFDEHTMNLPTLRKLCEQKISRTHRAHRTQARVNQCVGEDQAQAMALLAAREERRRKGDRMTTRRHGVCPF